MRHTGRYDPIENGYDLDEKINEVANLTQKFITDLIEDVGTNDYKQIAAVIIQEHLDVLDQIKKGTLKLKK